MNNIDDEKLITKATFEDVLKSQQRLRIKITELIKENRCLTADEKTEFFDLLARCTFGAGVSKPFKIFVPEVINLGNVEKGARIIANQNTNNVILRLPGLQPSRPVPIKFLWNCLLEALFDVFALALNLSASMSKERSTIIEGKPYDFNPDE